MITAAFSNSRIDLRPGTREIQAGWSPQERRARAIEGRRRMQELFRMVEGAPSGPEIWAVGALAGDDLQRLVG